MVCSKPIYIDKHPEKGILVPCGKCRACRIIRIDEWVTRMVHESEFHKKTCFITLTYQEDQLPVDLSVNKEEFQLFIKRLRKIEQTAAVKEKRTMEKIKYFACGEYGDDYGRPHYHAIIFGIGTLDHQYNRYGHVIEGPVLEAWNNEESRGFVEVSDFLKERARYCVRYLLKSEEEPCGEFYRGAPFQLQSQGMGLSYIEKYGEKIRQLKKITIEGHVVAIPKYYKNKLNLELSKERREVIKKLYEHYRKKGVKIIHNFHGYNCVSWQDFCEEVEKALEQQEKNLKAKSELKTGYIKEKTL